LNRLKRLRERGMKPKEIAKKLKLGVSIVYRYLETEKKEGFFRRLKSELGLK
jgi:transposase